MTTLYAEIEDSVTHQKGFVFAAVRNSPLVAVSVPDLNAATRYYCAKCQRLFKPVESCPSCGEGERKSE